MLKHLISTAGVGPVELVDRFLTWWSVETLTQLGDMLQSPIDAPSLQQLMLEGHAKVSTPLMLAVIAFAWAHTSDADRSLLLQGDTERKVLLTEPNFDTCRYQQIVKLLGCPLPVIPRMAQEDVSKVRLLRRSRFDSSADWCE